MVRAVGCNECGFTGYKGRIPVNEVMLAGPRFQTAVEARKGWQTLHRVAIQGGMRPMHQVALDWVAEGKTTLVEVERSLGQRQSEDVPVRGQRPRPGSSWSMTMRKPGSWRQAYSRRRGMRHRWPRTGTRPWSGSKPTRASAW